MTLVDDRGRVLGRINLIDLALAAFAIVLIPLGYGAYVVFRTPPPRIVSVAPNTVTYAKGEQHVIVNGEHLRPFMKAQLGKLDARAFIVERPDSGELRFIDVPPGTYDVSLFDESDELTRLPNALTILPPAQPPVQLVGRFAAGDAAAALTAGATFSDRDHSSIVIVAIEAAAGGGGRAATLRAACDASQRACTVGGAPVEIGKPLALGTATGGAVTFVPDEVRIDADWSDVEVRLFGIAEALDLMKTGDIDRHAEPEAANQAHVLRGAVVRTLDKPQPTQGVLSLNFSQLLPDAGAFPTNTAAAGYLPLQTRLATLRVPLEHQATGWYYRSAVIRPGSALTFETEDYLLHAVVLRVAREDRGRAAAGHP